MHDTYQMRIDIKKIKNEILSLSSQNDKISLIGLHREVDTFFDEMIESINTAEKNLEGGNVYALAGVQAVINRFKEGW